MVSNDTIVGGGVCLISISGLRVNRKFKNIHTVKDLRFRQRSEMRVFGRRYHESSDVYIKIRVELLSATGNHTAFVMSFHYAEISFAAEIFPYRKSGV